MLKNTENARGAKSVIKEHLCIGKSQYFIYHRIHLTAFLLLADLNRAKNTKLMFSKLMHLRCANYDIPYLKTLFNCSGHYWNSDTKITFMDHKSLK